MRILIGVIVALLVITVAFGVRFLGVFGESSSTTTAGPPPVHNAVLMPLSTGRIQTEAVPSVGTLARAPKRA